MEMISCLSDLDMRYSHYLLDNAIFVHQALGVILIKVLGVREHICPCVARTHTVEPHPGFCVC